MFLIKAIIWHLIFYPTIYWCIAILQVFSKVAAIDLGEENTEIKITHQKWKISCIWSLDKLKGRLVRMRKLIYAVGNRPGYVGDLSVLLT